MRRSRPLGLLAAILLNATAHGQDKSYLPAVAGPSAEPEQARRGIRVPEDVAASLFAAEPRLANPVAFTADEKGRFYVVETFRHNAGVTDDRNHMYWLDEDLASRTVADREAMLRKWLGKDVGTFAVEHDRVRRIEDRDGDGKADHDTVFADGFHEIATGIAAGILVRKGDAYFACIPDLWLLKDADGDGRADSRKVLSTGYGVHVAFLGHDLHGLIFGPDGRLYFSVGDRGLDVARKDGPRISCPDTGAVLRCEPDGSQLELFATGLRNPQELAFDNQGNLFTVDNNSDSGDKARVVHVVQGGDSGWRIGYQYIDVPNSRGPWNAEKLWHPAPDNTSASIVPPLLNLSDGPSGFTFDPGVTLLPDRYKDHFFLADFRGGAGQSGIRSFAVERAGASFRVVDAQQPFWSVLATDVDFGPDGALYVSDWVDGWNKTGKGRLWRFADPKREGLKSVKDVQKAIAEGMSGRQVDALAKLLGHPDRRLRQAAQFELVDRAIRDNDGAGPGRKPGALDVMRDVAEWGKMPLARLHALWGLGQFERRYPGSTRGWLAGLRYDPESEVRASVVKLLGERPGLARVKPGEGMALLGPSLDDVSPRVRFFAAQSLGKLGDVEAIGPLFRLLASNDDRDPYLRHAAVTGLAGIGEVGPLAAAATHPSAAVRLGALLALRRFDPESLAGFLGDRDPKVVLEAARGIYDDEPRPGRALEALASLATRPQLDTPPEDSAPRIEHVATSRPSRTQLNTYTLRRVVNANARLGGPARAEALAKVAADADRPQAIRVEALELLGAWAKDSGRDHLSGLWRPYPARPKGEAAAALRGHLDDLLRPAPAPVQRAAIVAAGSLGVIEAVPALLKLAGDESAPASTRVAALKAIEATGDPRLSDAVTSAIEAEDGRVRVEAQRLLVKTRPELAIPLLVKVLGSGSIRERQGALATLAGLNRPEADAILAAQLKSGDLPPEAELDLLEAAEKRAGEPAIKAGLADRARPVAANDPIAGYRATLVGGDAARGRAIYQNNTAVYCVRCHKVRGEGGEVGPDLTGIGARQTREYLATSIVHPNAAIAQGFETVIVSTADGRVVSGVFKAEDDKALRLVDVEGRPIVVPKADIEDRKRGPSAMPEELAKKLSKPEIRDLVEFLSSLK